MEFYSDFVFSLHLHCAVIVGIVSYSFCALMLSKSVQFTQNTECIMFGYAKRYPMHTFSKLCVDLGFTSFRKIMFYRL
jgi:hypothetical protein